MPCTEFRRSQEEVERLLDDLRRLVAEAQEVQQNKAAGSADLDANREEAERVRWRIASVLRATAPTP